MTAEEFYAGLLLRVDQITAMVTAAMPKDAGAEEARNAEIRWKEMTAREMRAESDLIEAELRLDNLRKQIVQNTPVDPLALAPPVTPVAPSTP